MPLLVFFGSDNSLVRHLFRPVRTQNVHTFSNISVAFRLINSFENFKKAFKLPRNRDRVHVAYSLRRIRRDVAIHLATNPSSKRRQIVLSRLPFKHVALQVLSIFCLTFLHTSFIFNISKLCYDHRTDGPDFP